MVKISIIKRVKLNLPCIIKQVSVSRPLDESKMNFKRNMPDILNHIIALYSV